MGCQHRSLCVEFACCPPCSNWVLLRPIGPCSLCCLPCCVCPPLSVSSLSFAAGVCPWLAGNVMFAPCASQILPSLLLQTNFYSTPLCPSACVTPFGMCSAPVTFQRLIKIVGGAVLYYLDELVVYTPSWDEHVNTLRTVWALGSGQFNLELAKCDFGRATVTYLGNEVRCSRCLQNSLP